MKKRTSIEEMNAICTMLISDFLKKFHYSNTRVIDIEDDFGESEIDVKNAIMGKTTETYEKVVNPFEEETL